MNYRTKHFILQELVPQTVYQALGDRAWQLLDGRQLVTIDALRSALGPVVINNWHIGGNFDESGFRGSYSRTGALYSQHRYGRANDCKLEIHPKEAFDFIIRHQSDFPYITAIEDTDKTPTWLHIDCRNSDWEGIRVIQP